VKKLVQNRLDTGEAMGSGAALPQGASSERNGLENKKQNRRDSQVVLQINKGQGYSLNKPLAKKVPSNSRGKLPVAQKGGTGVKIGALVARVGRQPRKSP